MYYNNNKVRYGRCYKTFSTYFSATIFFFYQFYVEGEQITTKSTYFVQYSFFYHNKNVRFSQKTYAGIHENGQNEDLKWRTVRFHNFLLQIFNLETINKKQSLLSLNKYDRLHKISINQVKTLIHNRVPAIKVY